MSDRRAQRNRETRREIIDAAWAIADRDGIAGLSLRGLAREVGMRAPSLYNYFECKDALYDAMFVDGNQQLTQAFDEWRLEGGAGDDAVERVTVGTKRFIGFCQESVARYQLLFTPAVPGWRPSEDAYAHAATTYERMVDFLATAGIASSEDVDLFTAISSGLAAQQMANDPAGDRWAAIAPRAIRMLIRDIHEREDGT